jgi:hypothetical protein
MLFDIGGLVFRPGRPSRTRLAPRRTGWRLKTYSITLPDAALQSRLYDEGLPLAAAALPRPAQAVHRPGVGVAIFHQGRGVHYLVLAWWDHENELPLHILVRPVGDGAAWRAAQPHESVCVWDLEVPWHERQSYVAHVLGPASGPDLDAYLRDAAGAARRS